MPIAARPIHRNPGAHRRRDVRAQGVRCLGEQLRDVRETYVRRTAREPAAARRSYSGRLGRARPVGQVSDPGGRRWPPVCEGRRRS